MSRSELEKQGIKQVELDNFAKKQGFPSYQEMEDSRLPLGVRRLLTFVLFLFGAYFFYSLLWGEGALLEHLSNFSFRN
jgi:hypothetical protein